jgi:hypothetical protein
MRDRRARLVNEPGYVRWIEQAHLGVSAVPVPVPGQRTDPIGYGIRVSERLASLERNTSVGRSTPETRP